MGRHWKWQIYRNKVIERDNFRCSRCSIERKKKCKINGFVIYGDNLVVDHIIPIKLGGEEFDYNNLQTLCINCNKEKNKWDQSFIARLKRISKDKEFQYD